MSQEGGIGVNLLDVLLFILLLDLLPFHPSSPSPNSSPSFLGRYKQHIAVLIAPPQQSPSPHLHQQSAGLNFAPSHHHRPHTTPPQPPLTQQLLASSTPTHTVTHPPGMYALHQQQQGHTPNSRYPGQLNSEDQVTS